jgi:hypothetical protein
MQNGPKFYIVSMNYLVNAIYDNNVRQFHVQSRGNVCAREVNIYDANQLIPDYVFEKNIIYVH